MNNEYSQQFLHQTDARKFQKWCKEKEKITSERDNKTVYINTKDPSVNLEEYASELLESFLEENEQRYQINNNFNNEVINNNQSYHQFQAIEVEDVKKKITDELFEFLLNYINKEKNPSFEKFRFMVFTTFTENFTEIEEILESNEMFQELIKTNNEIKEKQQKQKKSSGEKSRQQNSDKKEIENEASIERNKKEKANEEHICYIKSNHQRNECENLHESEYNLNALDFFLKLNKTSYQFTSNQLKEHIHENGFKFISTRWESFLKNIMSNFYNENRKCYNFFKRLEEVEKVRHDIKNQFQELEENFAIE